jgi:hypothetical protein
LWLPFADWRFRLTLLLCWLDFQKNHLLASMKEVFTKRREWLLSQKEIRDTAPSPQR